MNKPWSKVAAAAISSFLLGSPALATFHLWNISEIYSNADGTVQYIELFTTANSQQFTIGTRIRASQSASTNDFVFPGNAPAPTAGHHLLLATADFAALPGAVTPDFTLPDGFLFTPDGIVNYIGANSLSYDCLPTSGTLSIHCDANNGISCMATSVGVNSPTNYAGATGSIDAGGGGCTDTDDDGICDVCDPCAGGPTSGDTDADGSVDLDDFVVFESCLVGPDGGLGTGCECFDFDTDNDVDLENYAAFQGAFSVP